MVDHLTDVIERFTEILGLTRHALFIFDYGAPVGLRFAVRHPERITVYKAVDEVLSLTGASSWGLP